MLHYNLIITVTSDTKITSFYPKIRYKHAFMTLSMTGQFFIYSVITNNSLYSCSLSRGLSVLGCFVVHMSLYRDKFFQLLKERCQCVWCSEKMAQNDRNEEDYCMQSIVSFVHLSKTVCQPHAANHLLLASYAGPSTFLLFVVTLCTLFSLHCTS